MLDELARALTRRPSPLIDRRSDPAFARVAGQVAAARILVVGGAGSIGKAVVEAIVELGPKGLYVVDIDENGMADLVRELRSGTLAVPGDFRTSIVDLGAPGLERLVHRHGPFDVALNLAALKHVRSERDVFTLARMIDVNVRAVAGLCRLTESGKIGRVFSVSSDKAVSPHSLMGATKRWMEHIVIASGGTSARFANVAFSKGALPAAILQRLERAEPVAAPIGITRYFITREEAAHLCLLSAFDAAPGEILVPDLNADAHAVTMVEVAESILRSRGLVPRLANSEAEAKRWAQTRPADSDWWPCLFEPAETAGEKPMEELLHPSDAVDRTRYRSVAVVTPQTIDAAAITQAMRIFEAASTALNWRKEAFVDAIRTAVPILNHGGLEASLDERM